MDNNRLNAYELWEKAQTNKPITKKDLDIKNDSRTGIIREGIKTNRGVKGEIIK